MAQVIPNLGALSSFSTGLGQGIQSLAANKVAEMQKRNEENRYTQLLEATGKYTPAEARLAAARFAEKDFLEAAQMFQGGQALQKEANTQVSQPQQSNQELLSLQERLSNLQNQPRPEQISPMELLKSYQQGQLQKSQPQGLDLSNPQSLFTQAAQQGINLSPEQQEKIANKLQALQSDQQGRAKLEKDVMDYIQRNQQQPQQPQQGIPAETSTQQPFYKKPTSAFQQETVRHQIKLENQKDLEPLNKMIGIANEGTRIIDSILADLDSGKLYTGAIVGKTPIALLNQFSQETQDAGRNLENYLILKQGLLKGNPTSYRVKGLEKGKPSLSLSKEGLRKALLEEREPLEQIQGLENIRNQIISENGGEEPRNLNHKIKVRAAQQEVGNKKQTKFSVGQVLDDRPKNPKIGMQLLNARNEVEEWNGNKWINKGK